SKDRWIDMTHEMSNGAVIGGRYEHNVTFRGERGRNPSRYWYEDGEVYVAEHTGTHFAAPCHFARGKWRMEDIPPERLIQQAFVVDVSASVARDQSYEILPKDLIEWDKKNRRTIPPLSILLFHTGMGQHYFDKTRYMGTNNVSNRAAVKYPGIHVDTANWIVQNMNISGVGIDSYSVEGVRTWRDETYLTQRALAADNIYYIENMVNLDKIHHYRSTLFVGPMKIKGGSGSPVRVLAFGRPPKSDASASNLSILTTVCVLSFNALYQLFMRLA
ncbi:unnamed protein product, partial [Owenia fusiformis]